MEVLCLLSMEMLMLAYPQAPKIKVEHIEDTLSLPPPQPLLPLHDPSHLYPQIHQEPIHVPLLARLPPPPTARPQYNNSPRSFYYPNQPHAQQPHPPHAHKPPFTKSHSFSQDPRDTSSNSYHNSPPFPPIQPPTLPRDSPHNREVLPPRELHSSSQLHSQAPSHPHPLSHSHPSPRQQPHSQPVTINLQLPAASKQHSSPPTFHNSSPRNFRSSSPLPQSYSNSTFIYPNNTPSPRTPSPQPYDKYDKYDFENYHRYDKHDNYEDYERQDSPRYATTSRVTLRRSSDPYPQTTEVHHPKLSVCTSGKFLVLHGKSLKKVKSVCLLFTSAAHKLVGLACDGEMW